jgi:MFS family permease
MSVVTISPSLPEMNQAFSHVDNADFLVKMVLTIPALFIALSSMVAGILIDRYGRLKFLWGALLLYALSGTAGYWLDDIYHIFISRALLGVAVGISMTIVITLVADYFEGLERQQFIGLQIAFMSIGGILFIGLGGILADINWRVPFLIYLFSLIILPIAFSYLQEPTVVASTAAQKKGIKSPGIIWLLFANVMIMWILFFLIPVQVPFHLKEIGIEKNSLIGAAIALSTAFSAVSSISYSRIKNKFGFCAIFAAGYLIMAAGFVVLGYAQNFGAVALSMILAGFGMGMLIPNTNMWVMKIAPLEIRGQEMGKLTTFWFMGQFLSPIILFPITSQFSLSNTFLISAVIMVVLSLLFLILQFSSVSSKAN